MARIRHKYSSLIGSRVGNSEHRLTNGVDVAKLAVLIIALVIACSLFEATSSADGTQGVVLAHFTAATQSSEVSRQVAIAEIRKSLANKGRNLQDEFQLGLLLAESSNDSLYDISNAQQAIAVFDGILSKYNYRAYYTVEPADTMGSKELLIPRAAVVAASIASGKLNDGTKARQYTAVALAALKWIAGRRKADWLDAPPPIRSPFDRDDKFAAKIALWKNHQKLAKEGNVLGPSEMVMVKASVRQFGLSYGPQHPADVAPIMQRLITEYPNSTIALTAREHIQRAKHLINSAVKKPAYPVADSSLLPSTTMAFTGASHKMMYIALGCGAVAALAVVLGILVRRLRVRG